MNVRFALAGIAVLVLAACASTPTQPLAPPPPVKVVVTAAPSLYKLIDVVGITAETEQALRRFAPSATPATVTLNLSGTSLVTGGHMMSAESHGNPEAVTYVQTVASFSPTPWLDGFQPVISSYTVPAQGMISPGPQVAVQGIYTIVDANGVTLEKGGILLEPGRDQRAFAATVAKRVAQLAHGS